MEKFLLFTTGSAGSFFCLFGTLLLISSLGCKKNDNGPGTKISDSVSALQSQSQASLSELTTRENLSFECTFEKPNPFAVWNSQEKAYESSIKVINTNRLSQNLAARFKISKTDPAVYDGKRAELVLKPEATLKVERWYERPDFHLGETWRSPPISLQTVKGRWRLTLLWAKQKVNSKPEGRKDIDLGPCTNNVWNNWVMHIRFSFEDDGLIEVWRNKKLMYIHKGPNSYNDETGNYFKIGIYKWGWMPDQDSGISTTTTRIIYVDDVRIGNEKATFKDVEPLR
jgi:hypothetical protein